MLMVADKRQVIAWLVHSWTLFPNRKSQHDWVRAKQRLHGKFIKVPMALPKERFSSLFPRTYKEATTCQIYSDEFVKIGHYFSLHFWSL